APSGSSRRPRASIHRSNTANAAGSMPTVRDLPPFACSTRIEPLAASTSLGWSDRASVMRRPARYNTAIMARLGMPGGPVEQAAMSAAASDWLRTSGGKRRLGRRLRGFLWVFQELEYVGVSHACEPFRWAIESHLLVVGSCAPRPKRDWLTHEVTQEFASSKGAAARGVIGAPHAGSAGQQRGANPAPYDPAESGALVLGRRSDHHRSASDEAIVKHAALLERVELRISAGQLPHGPKPTLALSRAAAVGSPSFRQGGF